MDFIEFVTSLAPEGETVLFVQQKTKAWIPQLPAAPRRAGRNRGTAPTGHDVPGVRED